jgi:hypothetical protein
MGRTPKRRMDSRSEPPLTPNVLALLALGWSGMVLRDDDPDPFAPWALDDNELLALYHRHKGVVDAEARRHGRQRAWIAG